MTLPLTKRQLRMIRAAYRRTVKSFKIKERLRGSVWSEAHVTIPEETRGRSAGGKIKLRTFQICPADLQMSYQVSELYWQKSSRTGATKLICCGMMQCAENLQVNVTAYFPTDDDASKFSRVELEPAMKLVPAIRKIQRSTAKTAAENSQSLKMFIGSIWQILGGQAESNFRGRSPDFVWADEVPAFPHNIGKGGGIIGLMQGRVTESLMPKVNGYGSPGELPYCQITAAVKSADLQLQFYVPCKYCGQRQVLEEHEGSDVGLQFTYIKGEPKKSAETAHYVCVNERCKRQIWWKECRKEMLPRGRWETADGSVWHSHETGFLENKDGRLPGRWTVGLQSNILVSPAFGFDAWVRQLVTALDKAAAGDTGDLITFNQTRRGVPTEPESAGESLSEVWLSELAEPYPDDELIPEGVTTITIFIDCHQQRFEALVCGWGVGEECWCLEYLILHGNISKRDVWDRLKRVIEEREYIREDGAVMNIYLGGIDHGGHWADEVEKFSKEIGIDRLIPCKGIDGEGRQIVKYPRKTNDAGVFLTSVATNPAKVLVTNRLELDTSEYQEGVSYPGMIHFPQQAPGRYELFTMEFYKELASERRVFESGKWKWKQFRKNEAFDTLVGNLVVIRIAQLPQHGVVLGDQQYTTKTDTNYYGNLDEFERLAQESA